MINTFSPIGSTVNEHRKQLKQLIEESSPNQTIEDRTELYKSLNKLLSSGANDRFILYCPLYLIPKSSWYRNHNEIIDTFYESYIECWYRLLQTSDVRTNFTNGDTESKDRIIQAAYLAPTLLENGLISKALLSNLQDNAPSLLSDSLKDAFKNVNEAYPNTNHLTTKKTIHDSITYALDNLPSYKYIKNKKRANWLRWEDKRQTINKLGKSLSTILIAGSHNTTSLAEFIKTLKGNSILVAISGIGSAIERLNMIDKDLAIALYERCKPHLLELAKNDNTHTQELHQSQYISRTFCRLHSINIADQKTLNDAGIFNPDLSESPNLNHINKERQKIQKIINSRRLSQLILPVSIMFGSKLKGYSIPESDIDIAIFVKPNNALNLKSTNPKDIEVLDKLLTAKFGQEVAQYWLKEDGDNLKIQDLTTTKSMIGRSTDSHVLFGGTWEGCSDTISMLNEKLLKLYENIDEESRRFCIENLEQDALQYRLLHRGYTQFNVTSVNNTFLDDGYRKVASKLYSTRVFLPF